MYSPYRSPKKVKSKVDDNDLIEIVNQLQDKLAASGNTLNISLPQIVVVGCQSAGKSSVLENIVGREFLPRGSGVVTRRPTVVQLQPHHEEYGVFLHKPNETFRDFFQIKEEIRNETLRDPGPTGFSSKPISLKIYSPRVLKLTLVDLPGLIRVTVDNQSEDNIKEVRNMVLEYISQPNSLILAVSPANQDIANSDALEIAKTADPQRVRTIGVLTKLDLMDEGTHARDILENKKIPLKRGYVGVLNRSQRDIDEGKDIDYCLDKEKHFFLSMPCYKQMAERMGTPYLRKTLNQQLYEHIRESLPAVRQELSQKLAAFREELKTFKEQNGYNSGDPCSVQYYVTKLVENFVKQFHIEIFGYSEKIDVNKLSAGAMINYKLHKSIQNSLKLPGVPDRKKLLIIFANIHGIRLQFTQTQKYQQNCLSMPSLALETVMRDLLTQYNGPVNKLVDSIANILVLNIEKQSNLIDPYPTLRNEILYFIQKSIDENSKNTKNTLANHMKAEMYFINTYQNDFNFPNMKQTDVLFPMKLWNFGELNQSEKVDTCDDTDECDCEENVALEILAANGLAVQNAKMLSEIIQNYIKIHQKHIEDVAIKYILYFLVKEVMEFVEKELIPTILNCASSDVIFEECEKDFNKMSEIESTCNCLEEALIAVQTF